MPATSSDVNNKKEFYITLESHLLKNKILYEKTFIILFLASFKFYDKKN